MKPPALVAGLLLWIATGATADEPSLTELYERVIPAVVEIATISEIVPSTGPAQQVRTGGLGSGFLISDEGVILTAAHVVHLAEDVAVRWANGEISPATIVSSSPSADLAMIRAETVPSSVTPLVLADSDSVKVGEQVFIIGAPLGYAHTLTEGHVSARRIPEDLFGGIEPVELLQTDAAINEGNSGGPMFNMAGEVIGVVSHIMSNSGGSQGLGFVVTSNMARTEMLEKKPFWSGMDGTQLTDAWAGIFNLPQPAGILVEQVAAGSASATLGLRPGTFRAEIEGRSLMVGGDVILAIQGVPVGAADFGPKVRSATKDLGDDDLFELQVLRAGQVISLTTPVGQLR
ncbi:MAG: trypsin-like peptidase domain-containing protein [Thermoanaerobaculales bacterium]|jgi:S1-C subfamily serine protease|nr:trypsin-like peptidase domain-containing protein [Thermoanaerobaculales bacterium]